MLSSPWPYWSRHFRPSASRWLILWFRLENVIRLSSSRSACCCTESPRFDVEWSIHPTSSPSIGQSFCHRTFGFQLLFRMLRPCSFGVRFLLTLSSSFSFVCCFQVFCISFPLDSKSLWYHLWDRCVEACMRKCITPCELCSQQATQIFNRWEGEDTAQALMEVLTIRIFNNLNVQEDSNTLSHGS